MGVTRTMLGRAALVFLLVSFALPGPARAEPTEAERMARWADLRHAIFGDRLVEEAGDLVAIDAPARAEDAPANCEIPAYLLTSESPLPKVEAAVVGEKRLEILVGGSRSSSIFPNRGNTM